MGAPLDQRQSAYHLMSSENQRMQDDLSINPAMFWLLDGQALWMGQGDALGTKGHFNPDGAPHGKHGGAAHHAGDLPALKADANGVAEINVLVKKLTVAAGPASVVGRGLIVHRDPDDYTTQPTGNAGPRPGCAVIRAE